MTWASYARVSSDGQTGLDRYGLERQDRANDRYIRTQGHSGHVTAFRDVISGTQESREQFEKLLSAARAREVTRVVIPEIDRLARNSLVGVALLFELWDAGLEVHHAEKGMIDRNDGSSRREFLRGLVEADSELEKITKRLYHGKLEKARSGRTVFKMRAYGWKDGKINTAEKPYSSGAPAHLLVQACTKLRIPSSLKAYPHQAGAGDGDTVL
jgi:DNA invertase Pin-like site-specific DNA recombinase